MVMLYHGSDKKFEKFKIPDYHKTGSDLGFGVYLTDDIERAKRYANNGFVYDVKFDIEGNKSVSADHVTLDVAAVTKLIEGVAREQIRTDEYPYILSDWGEIGSETEIDDYNHELAKNIAKNTIDNSDDDLDIINDLGNQLGGTRSAAITLDPVLEDMNIHYAVRNFEDQKQDNSSKVSQEYIVFNPDDLVITKARSSKDFEKGKTTFEVEDFI